MPDTHTATVKKIVYGGWGLAHHEGKTLFLPCTAPGDTVAFTITAEKKRVLFGQVERIVDPSPQRREPPCPVFGRCGGCHFQHLSYEDELEAKRIAVLENLERIGKIKTGIEQVIPSPERFGYRNHAVFRIDEAGGAGFLMRESNTVVSFPSSGCLLLPGGMRDGIAALPTDELPRGREVRTRMDRFGAVHFWGLRDTPGPPESLMEAGGLLFPVAPTSFFQANRYLNDRLLELVASLPAKVRRTLLDLYCGVGFFTLGLSRTVVEAIGVERDESSYRSATAAARLNKITNVRFKRGDAAEVAQKARDVDLVLADPPRTGIAVGALEGIVRLRPRELVIVSCEPPTFARDAARLVAAGFIPSAIHLIDLFPATYHIEIVGLFRRS